MFKKQKKVYTVSNYIEHLLILVSSITACVSISSFASLVDIPLGIASSAVGLKICIMTTAIKQFN